MQIVANKKKKQKLSPRAVSNLEIEDRPAVAVTVAWMLASVCAATADVLWGISRLLVFWAVRDGGNPPSYALIPGAMWMIALITGTLGLVLMVVAYRVRTVEPPRSALVFSVIAGLVPYAALIAGFFQRS